MVASLERDGAVIVEGFLSDDLLQRFNADVEPVLANTPRGGSAMFSPFLNWFYGGQTRTITGLAGKSRMFATEVLTHPLYRALGDAVLLPNCACYRLNVAQVLDRGRGPNSSCCTATRPSGPTSRSRTPRSSWRR